VEITVSNQVCVIIPGSLREKAGELRINISEVCRKALADEVEKSEKVKAAGENCQVTTPDAANTEHKVSANV
jgi:post-segregation antitoxin (ccd killing protein)